MCIRDDARAAYRTMRSPFRTFDVGSFDPVLAKAVPVGVAVAAYGLSYGVLAVAAGLSPWLATLSSIVVLAGGSQFAFVGVLAAGGSPAMGALGGLLLNVRYLAFGFAIAAHLPRAGLARRALDGYLVVDESVAIGLDGPHEHVARRFRITAWTVVVAWIGATAIGAYAGSLLGDPEVIGLDAAFPAGFLALLAPWLRRPSGRLAALLGAVLAVGLTPLSPPGVPILVAAVGALAALPLLQREERRAAQRDGHTGATNASSDVADSPRVNGTPR